MIFFMMWVSVAVDGLVHLSKTGLIGRSFHFHRKIAKKGNAGGIAVSDKIGTGRARHTVRAVVCLPKFGAHGVTRPTS
jgi:hypothetical protein